MTREIFFERRGTRGTTKVITCYLDSQDYSTLTDPKSASGENQRIKDALLSLAASGNVKFTFSAPAICESVALTVDSVHLAILKAELLSALCGANALVSLDRLVTREATALASRSLERSSMLDPSGQWFPEIPLDPSEPTRDEKIQALVKEEIESMGMSRQERRATMRKMLKNGKLHPKAQASLNGQDPKSYAAEVLKEYPMRPQEAEVMARYGLGRATESEFNDALRRSLLDPRWMMKWFASKHAISSPIAEMVRKPGRTMGEAMRQLATTSSAWAALLRQADESANPTGAGGTITKQWREMVETQLVNITKRCLIEAQLQIDNIESKDVDVFCPGISTGFRSLYSSVWENVGGSRKELPSNSQPVDALHSFYAPYVDVFRADRFMAPHIQRQVERFGTIVVPRLSNLISVLESNV